MYEDITCLDRSVISKFCRKALQRVLDARQLAMKFIANVTYGYTSASFSGRMPAVEIADAIVQSGRETLEKVPSLSFQVWSLSI